MNGQQIGNFRVIERIGEGGMGEVFRAVDTMLEREVALKTLRSELSAREELVERFRVEAIALAKLHHPHIAAVYSFFRENERYHMAMQFVHGQTLENLLKHRARLPWREAAQITLDVLQALVHAHGQGVIHRDLKPANLMLDPSGRTVVMDFGIARVLARARQTRVGNLVGTMEYIAPEIIRGENPDPRADLYSLGVVLFELVTGRLPFIADTDFALMRAHTEMPPPLPTALCAELPQPIEAIILTALAKQPKQRFADARAFIVALEQACGIEGQPRGEAQRLMAQPSLLQRWSLRLKHVKLRPGLLMRSDWVASTRQRLGSLAKLGQSTGLNAGRQVNQFMQVQLQTPSAGGMAAWVAWSRNNAGLAMAGAAAIVAIGFVLAGLLAPAPIKPDPKAPDGQLPVDPHGLFGPVKPVIEKVTEADPPPPHKGDFVIPNPKPPNIVIDPPVPPAPAPTPPPRPRPEPPQPQGGWTIKK